MWLGRGQGWHQVMTELPSKVMGVSIYELDSHFSLPPSPQNWYPQGRLSRCPNNTMSQAAEGLAL